MTAEPRMEDLLASIRKAITEDIGDVPAVPSSEKGQAAAPRPQPQPRAEDPAPTSNEIQQLREKITRSRAAEQAAPRDPSQRAASLAAALRSDTPRRAWGEIEPAPPKQPLLSSPGLRGSILDGDAPRPAARPAPVGTARPAPRFSFAERQPLKPATPPAPVAADDGAMLSGGSAQAVQSAFSRLADSVLARATGDRSIEDMTRELLRVMLKQWLDENLPAMVERLVREEIERVARSGR